MQDAFFLPVGEEFLATKHTIGPWSPEHQHAGPPAALLARAFEHAAGDMAIVRITYELMRPVPVAQLRIDVKELRPGRNIRIYGASLWTGTTELVRATALCIRQKAMRFDPAPATPPIALLPSPEESEAMEFPFFMTEVGYHKAMDLRFARGGIGEGHSAAWLRMKHPLVEGEAPTPLQRVAIAADSGNGVSAALDWNQYVFINPDLTIYVHRMPQGEWIGLDAHTLVRTSGIGIADDQLHDDQGPIGRAVQSLFIDEVPAS